MKKNCDIWSRSGAPLIYPGLHQNGNSCVLVSIGGALNHLAGTNLSENEILDRVRLKGVKEINFQTVLDCVGPELSKNSISVERYHDEENPLQSVDLIIAHIQRGAVLIVSLELAAGQDLSSLTREKQWHMLSVFNLRGDNVQVWDTNGKEGFFSEAELKEFLVGDTLAIPYLPLGYLVSHDQHELLVLSRNDCLPPEKS
jgi:hypothetical protein